MLTYSPSATLSSEKSNVLFPDLCQCQSVVLDRKGRFVVQKKKKEENKTGLATEIKTEST